MKGASFVQDHLTFSVVHTHRQIHRVLVYHTEAIQESKHEEGNVIQYCICYCCLYVSTPSVPIVHVEMRPVMVQLFLSFGKVFLVYFSLLLVVHVTVLN